MSWLVNIKSFAIILGFWLWNADRERVHCSNGPLKWALKDPASVNTRPAPQVFEFGVEDIQHIFHIFENPLLCNGELIPGPDLPMQGNGEAISG